MEDKNIRGDKGEDKNKVEEQESVDQQEEDQQEESREERTEISIKEHRQITKGLVAWIIVLAGIAVGSLFIDIAQFFAGSGYSKRALSESELFVLGDKTWVAFEEPRIEVQVLTISEEKLEACQDENEENDPADLTATECQNLEPTNVLTWLKKFFPTMVAQRVDVDSEEGQQLIEQYNIKTIPAFVFSPEVEEVESYQEARQIFIEKENGFVLNTTQMGIPPGKYVETPSIEEDDPVIGNRDAEVKVVVFSDFQCPFCSRYYNQITEVAREFEDGQVALTYKDFPLNFHPHAQAAATLAHCAGEQGKFWEMADMLYNNQEEWGEVESEEARGDLFVSYAGSLNLDTQQVTQCLESDKYADKIASDLQLGRDFGVSGTPATFVGDEFVSGVATAEQIRSLIQEQLSEEGGEEQAETESQEQAEEGKEENNEEQVTQEQAEESPNNQE